MKQLPLPHHEPSPTLEAKRQLVVEAHKAAEMNRSEDVDRQVRELLQQISFVGHGIGAQADDLLAKPDQKFTVGHVHRARVGLEGRVNQLQVLIRKLGVAKNRLQQDPGR